MHHIKLGSCGRTSLQGCLAGMQTLEQRSVHHAASASCGEMQPSVLAAVVMRGRHEQLTLTLMEAVSDGSRCWLSSFCSSCSVAGLIVLLVEAMQPAQVHGWLLSGPRQRLDLTTQALSFCLCTASELSRAGRLLCCKEKCACGQDEHQGASLASRLADALAKPCPLY